MLLLANLRRKQYPLHNMLDSGEIWVRVELQSIDVSRTREVVGLEDFTAWFCERS